MHCTPGYCIPDFIFYIKKICNKIRYNRVVLNGKLNIAVGLPLATFRFIVYFETDYLKRNSCNINIHILCLPLLWVGLWCTLPMLSVIIWGSAYFQQYCSSIALQTKSIQYRLWIEFDVLDIWIIMVSVYIFISGDWDRL